MRLRKNNWVLFLFLFCCFLFAQTSHAQTNRVDELRDEIRELERQSNEYKKLVSRKQQEGSTLKKEITILENQLAKLKLNILASVNRIELTRLEITDLNGQISKTKEKIDKNREIVSGLIRDLNYFEKRDLASILLSNARISDFFNQIEYANNLQASLFANLGVFLDLKEELDMKKGSAETKKNQLETLNRRQKNQENAAQGTKSLKDDILAKTKGDEKKFQELLTEVEKKKAEFYAELQKLEEEARREGIYIVRVKAAAIPPRGVKIFKMPMDDHIITQGYGMTKFARRGAYNGAPHNGIDMTAGFGSEIRSIGPGTVLAKGFNNAGGNWAAIRHDNDLVSVYGHMRDPALVFSGEKVDENTVIGYEGATGFVTGSHLHLSLYHEFFTFIGPKTGQVYFNYFDGSLNPLDYTQ